jgi:SAM-dependent methyltransferase
VTTARGDNKFVMTQPPDEDQLVTRRRDVQAFDDRALNYEDGLLGRMHGEIVAESVDLALALAPSPARVLDVGCGTGLLLRQLARRLPDARVLTGLDPAAGMIAVAKDRSADPRLGYRQAAAERLPFDDASFDLVISTTSFDHWADQRAGLGECHRVLEKGGLLVLTDLFSLALLPTTVIGRRDRARTQLRATKLLAAARFTSIAWHRLNSVIVQSVTARA